MREETKNHYITKLLHTAEQGAVALSKAYNHSAKVESKTADVGKANSGTFWPKNSGTFSGSLPTCTGMKAYWL